MGGYVINDITFGTANYSSVIQFNNYYKVTYEDGHHSPEDVKGMLRFELAPYENVEKDHEYWSDPDLYLYAMLDGGFSGGSTILGNPRAPWSKAYIGEINCEDIKFGFGMSSIFDVLGNIRNLSYVTHYSSTALTPSSTNSNALLDNTDNLKVGDKVIDSSGVLFSITAIDTQNSTFTIGTALIDLAQDSNVVHKSGDETVIGSKRFGVVQSFTGFPTIRLYSTDDDATVVPPYAYQQDIRFTDKNNVVIAYFIFQHRTDSNEPFRTCWRQQKMDGTQGYYSINFNNKGVFYPENNNAIDLGGSGNRWKSVYATNYYYGSNNIEFSTKFVTTDTNQTITATKTFDGVDINFKSNNAEYSVTGGYKDIFFLDKNSTRLAYFRQGVYSSGLSYQTFNILGYNSNNQQVSQSITFSSGNLGLSTAFLKPDTDNAIALGRSNYKWSDVQTYKVNGVEPSSLSLPDLNNGIDISSYIDVTQTSQYTAPANGYISICGYASSNNAILIQDHDYNFAQTARAVQTSLGSTTYLVFPVNKNHTYDIICNAVTNIQYAYFYPCLGNV